MVDSICPGCGAPLTLMNGAGYVTCKFCGMSVRADENPSVDPGAAKDFFCSGDSVEAFRLLSELAEKNPNDPAIWLMKGNCAPRASERDAAYANADRILRSCPSESALLEVRWTSMVFNWKCELTIDDLTFRLGGMERYRALVPKGDHTFVFRCPSANLETKKEITVKGDRTVSLEAKKGLLSKSLSID